MQAILTARSLSMEYPGVKALRGVDFELRAGEIHALCGENGAGKSTLIKILSGIIPHGRYGGTVQFNEKDCRFTCPADALKTGIRVIHQELALAEDLSVAENVCLGEEPTRLGLLDKRRMAVETREQMKRLGLGDLDPGTISGILPVGMKQMVEIARALRHKGKILILDEPTSALSARESANLEKALLRLRDESYAILYISHRLDEVFRMADRITVLRNGESAGTLSRSEFDSVRIVSLMVGRGIAELFPERNLLSPKSENREILLSVRNWSLASPANPEKPLLENISFELHSGEILGLAGLMGSGRTELVESLCGLSPTRGQGKIQLEGKPYIPHDVRSALSRNLALLCEDRRGHGIMPDKSVRLNMTYASLKDYCAGNVLLRWNRESEAVQTQIDAHRIKTPHMEFSIGNLSGGNQQKVLIGRALLARPKVLILDEPTRGIDVGAKSEIYRLIQKLASEGMGIILISSELEEVLMLSHRILVLRNGHAVAERAGGDLELNEALALAAGAA